MPVHRLALDKSVRSFDKDGRLRVELSNISKAMVCPYFGREIPDSVALGLDDNTIYMLFREPDELAKAAHTFENLPLMYVHKPTKADDHPKEVVVGSVGSPVFEPPYLKASLLVWTAEAIAGIESKEQTELSSAYHYRADMTPGTHEGIAYDGVMRDISGNHVALVDIGRAGPDVVVGDSQIAKGPKMPTPKLSRTAVAIAGALRVVLTPHLAQDQKLGSLAPFVTGLTKDNAKEQIKPIITRIRAELKGKLAQDASLDDLDKVLDALVTHETDEIAGDEDDDEMEDDPDNPGQMRKKAKAAVDEDPDMKPETFNKAAMDAAISSAVDAGVGAAVKAAVKATNDLHEARREVAPLVGVVALDSAVEVYRFALDQAGVDLEGVHASAFRPLVKNLLANKTKSPTVAPRLAADAAAVKEIATRFPDLGRFTTV